MFWISSCLCHLKNQYCLKLTHEVLILKLLVWEHRTKLTQLSKLLWDILWFIPGKQITMQKLSIFQPIWFWTVICTLKKHLWAVISGGMLRPTEGFDYCNLNIARAFELYQQALKLFSLRILAQKTEWLWHSFLRKMWSFTVFNPFLLEQHKLYGRAKPTALGWQRLTTADHVYFPCCSLTIHVFSVHVMELWKAKVSGLF